MVTARLIGLPNMAHTDTHTGTPAPLYIHVYQVQTKHMLWRGKLECILSAHSRCEELFALQTDALEVQTHVPSPNVCMHVHVHACICNMHVHVPANVYE